MGNYRDIPSYAYMSVIVPYFCRPEYLRRLIASVHKWADMPFEILVHDDGSTDKSQNDIFTELDKVSTLILDTGPPLGLAASINRLVKLSSSDYILMMNADCMIARPCLAELVETLSHPYIGAVTFECSGTKKPFYILAGIGAGCVSAFRREVWEQIGGWNEYMHSPAADISFASRVIRAGYFVGTLRCPRPFVNMSLEEKGNSDTTIGTKNEGFDNSYPKLFNTGLNMGDENRERAGAICSKASEHYTDPEKEANVWYWHNVMKDIVGDCNVSGKEFHWDKADKYGHSRWRNIIEEEYV